MKEHELKTWPVPFAAVWEGDKAYEIRKDDRGFKVGDTLRMREYIPNMDTFTGREVHAVVTWMSRGPDWGLPDGLCVMSIRVFTKVDPGVAVTS